MSTNKTELNKPTLEQLTIGVSFTHDKFCLITQEKINQFASTSCDHQWIHLDTKRCVTQSPYETTIAHGFLILSLMPYLFAESLTIDDTTTTLINYGVDKLRFMEAVRVNDEIKYRFTLIEIENKALGDLYKFTSEVEIRGRDKPALIGTFLFLVLK